MKLINIQKITATIKLQSGLHIGAGHAQMHIGGTDNPVIKNHTNSNPYIPGSSIKGKIRSLLEWHIGTVGDTDGAVLSFQHIGKLTANQDDAKTILKLFGGAADNNTSDELLKQIGPTRLSFWDCNLNPDWLQQIENKNLQKTEIKMENTIDRIQGTAANPRNIERVPAGAEFDFNLSVRVHDNDDNLEMILKGLKLLELTGLGGSISRGFGKIKFENLKLDDKDIQEKLDQIQIK
ncbi:MAG: type III-A CRISPR-associated RAMP protein Csm3 [Gammaproteobacteria bacterium]|nr:MAG: type III-A CRISPR-associated RAMP protein Csm3 [Gammaproteobacteria bacterium]